MKRFGRLSSMRLALLFLLMTLPAVATAQAAVTDAAMMIEWHNVQTKMKTNDRPDRWRELDLEQLDTFIDLGADVSLSDRRGWTTLHSAARYSSDPGIVRAPLDAGAAVGARNRIGATPLHWAAAENANVEVVRVLIRAGADINGRDKFGWLPVPTAAETNPNPDVIGALLAEGSETEKKAYFIPFRPAFLLEHDARMSNADKERTLAMLQGTDMAERESNKQN